MSRWRLWLLKLPGARWIGVRLIASRIRSELEKLGIREGDVMGSLAGKKTYITAGLAVLTKLVSYLVGESDLQTVLSEAWAVLMPLAMIFLRQGVAAGPSPTPPSA